MLHLGSFTISGEILLNMPVINTLSPFQYHLVLTTQSISQIYLNPIEEEVSEFKIEIPIASHPLSSTFSKHIFILLLLYSKTILVEADSSAKNMIIDLLQNWEIEFQFKSRQNIHKFWLAGPCCLSRIDFETLPMLGMNFNQKNLSELKAHNSFIFLKQYFEEKIKAKLYESDDIDDEFDSAMMEIKILYRELAGTDRFPYKSKQYSFEKLFTTIKEQLMGHQSSDGQNSIQQAIQQALNNMFQEEYDAQIQRTSIIDQQFYKQVSVNFMNLVSNDQKVQTSLKIILERIFNDHLSQTNPKTTTQYKLMKKYNNLAKQVRQLTQVHQQEKKQLFNKIYQKEQALISSQNQIKLLEEQLKAQNQKRQKNKTQVRVQPQKNCLKSEQSNALMSQRSTKDLSLAQKKQNMKKKKIQPVNSTLKKVEPKKKEEKRNTLGQKNFKI